MKYSIFWSCSETKPSHRSQHQQNFDELLKLQALRFVCNFSIECLTQISQCTHWYRIGIGFCTMSKIISHSTVILRALHKNLTVHLTRSPLLPTFSDPLHFLIVYLLRINNVSFAFRTAGPSFFQRLRPVNIRPPCQLRHSYTRPPSLSVCDCMYLYIKSGQQQYNRGSKQCDLVSIRLFA